MLKQKSSPKKADAGSLGRNGQDEAKPPPSQRSSKKVRPADRRERILSAAAQLFAEYGFEATSIRQIAGMVKMLPGSLYHHFGRKEDILHEILKEPLKRMTEANAVNMGASGNAEERLIATVVDRFRDAVANWEVHAILVNDGAFLRRREEFSYVQDVKSQSFRLQESIIVDGMRSKLFRSDIDVYMMIGTIARLLSSAAEWFRSHDYLSAGSDNDYTLDRVVNFHVDCVLRLVRSQERLERPVSLNLARRQDIGEV